MVEKHSVQHNFVINGHSVQHNFVIQYWLSSLKISRQSYLSEGNLLIRIDQLQASFQICQGDLFSTDLTATVSTDWQTLWTPQNIFLCKSTLLVKGGQAGHSCTCQTFGYEKLFFRCEQMARCKKKVSCQLMLWNARYWTASICGREQSRDANPFICLFSLLLQCPGHSWTHLLKPVWEFIQASMSSLHCSNISTQSVTVQTYILHVTKIILSNVHVKNWDKQFLFMPGIDWLTLLCYLKGPCQLV